MPYNNIKVTIQYIVIRFSSYFQKNDPNNVALLLLL